MELMEDAAEKMIIKNDKERGNYIYSFTGKQWTDARQYDLSIDTGKIGVDNATDLILNYLKIKIGNISYPKAINILIFKLKLYKKSLK